jgi:hypothetical protein
MEKRDRITIAVFLILLGGLALGTLCLPKKTYSELENRYLADEPEFTLRSLLSGTFMTDTDTYLSDHVVGKDALIFLKTGIERLEGRTLLQGVYYKEGSYFQHYDPSEKEMAQTLTKWETWADAAKGKTEFYVLPVPIGSEIYPEKLPAFAAEEKQAETFARIKNRFEGKAVVLDCRERLEGQKDAYLYFRTDHHWTMEGAYYGAAEFLAAQGKEVAPLSAFEREVLSRDFYGTLYSKAPSLSARKDELIHYTLPGVSCQVEVEGSGQISEGYLFPEKLEGKDQYGVFFGGNYGRVTIRNTSEPADYAGEGKLLIIKDSYANCLVPFLIPFYKEIDLIDPRYYIWDIGELIQNGEYAAVLVLQEV